MLPEACDAPFSDFQRIPIWIPGLFPDYVREYGVSDLSGGGRSGVAPGDDQAFLDDPCAMGMDVYSGNGTGLDRPV